MNDQLQLLKCESKPDRDTINRIAYEFRERITFPDELIKRSWYFFKRPKEYDDKVIEKKWNPEATRVLKGFSDRLKSVPDILNVEMAKNLLMEILDKQGMGPGKIMQLLRVLVTGESTGIDLMTTIEILGSHETALRIDQALHTLTD